MQTTIVGQKCLVIDPQTQKLLVIQRSDYKKDGGKRDLVGGSVAFGEDVSVAIKREAEEETGIVLGEREPLWVTSRLFAESSDSFFVFVLWVAETRQYMGEEIRLSHEHVARQRIDREQFDQLDLKDTVTRVKPQIATYMTKRFGVIHPVT